jgi:hypothetical protein
MRYVRLAPILATIACSAPKEAPPLPPSKVVEWAAIASAPKPGPDNTVLIALELQATVDPGWHVYSLDQTTGGPTPMSVKVSPPYSIDGEIVGPAPVKAKDPNFGIETETYSGEQIFKIPLKLAASASLSPPPIELKVRSQSCSDKLCLPARTTTLTVQPEKGTT